MSAVAAAGAGRLFLTPSLLAAPTSVRTPGAFWSGVMYRGTLPLPPAFGRAYTFVALPPVPSVGSLQPASISAAARADIIWMVFIRSVSRLVVDSLGRLRLRGGTWPATRGTIASRTYRLPIAHGSTDGGVLTVLQP